MTDYVSDAQARSLILDVGRGVTVWDGTGGYSGYYPKRV